MRRRRSHACVPCDPASKISKCHATSPVVEGGREQTQPLVTFSARAMPRPRVRGPLNDQSRDYGNGNASQGTRIKPLRYALSPEGRD
jgi:hypothetical protein